MVWKPPLADVRLGARLLWSMPRLRAGRITPDAARLELQTRLHRRADDFLDLIRRTVYERVGSPYRQLLRLAGCELGDLRSLVAVEGLEGALHALYRAGVYLTVDEYKGRRPVVRGSTTLAFEPRELGNPGVALHIPQYTSGSRGTATPASFDLAYVRERTVDLVLYLQAVGGQGWQFAIWEPPGGGAILRLLDFACLGTPLTRWFSPVDPASAGLNPHRRWIGPVLGLSGLLAGVPSPRPAVVPIDAPLPIVRWMAEVLRTGGAPHMWSLTPSCAVRLCQAAHEAGIDLLGARFTITGEPVTRTRREQIRRVGAAALPSYTTVDAGRIGFGCLVPEASDDVHILDDWHAVVQPGASDSRPHLPPQALLISSLRPSTQLIMINVSLGDQAELAGAGCGCRMEQLGWRRRLRAVRSFEKLTAGGMTFLDVDVIRVLDEVLPARFGGGPTDYQLVEDETPDGRPRLQLLVHPRVGTFDPSAVADTFLHALGDQSEGDRLMELQWRQEGVLRVERREPLTTRTGKILHLHLERTRPERDVSRPAAR